MIIHGLQKLTLLDYPGHTACTVFTGGCNYRCPYCHNAALVVDPHSQPVLDEGELFAFLKKRTGLLDGVAITGGEPTLLRDLPDFVRRVKTMGFAVKLDTNGTNPAVLASLLEEGLLDYVAMDIKTCRERYDVVTGVPGCSTKAVEESVALLMGGETAFEFRTTVVKDLHTEEDLVGIGRWIAGAPRYFLQAFKDSGGLLQEGLTGYNRAEMEALAAAVRPYVPSVQIRGLD